MQEKFERNGEKHRAVKYIADFQYVKEGRMIVEDFKGFQTDVSKLKVKWLLGSERYKDVDFQIIRRNNERKKRRYTARGYKLNFSNEAGGQEKYFTYPTKISP